MVGLYKDLLDERGAWHQRIAATLFHQGVPVTASISTAPGRAAVTSMDLSPAGRQAVGTALRQIDRLTGELDPLRRQLGMLSRRQPGCAALRATQFGVGAVTAVAIWAELGDVRRFSGSSDVVRHTGLDVTVYSSDGKRSAGHLSRQGPQLLRWALYEAAKCAARPAAPDYGYYTATRDRRTGGLATLSVARKLARRCYHTLRELGEEALAPPREPAARTGRRAREPMNLRPAPATSLLPGHIPGSLQRMSGRTPKPGHPIKHHVAGARHSAPRTEIRLGARHCGQGPANACIRPPPSGAKEGFIR